MYAEIYDKWECDAGHEATANLAQTCKSALFIQTENKQEKVKKKQLEKYSY
jgi:hypothetical protein